LLNYSNGRRYYWCKFQMIYCCNYMKNTIQLSEKNGVAQDCSTHHSSFLSTTKL
jgi:hypothetical protein